MAKSKSVLNEEPIVEESPIVEEIVQHDPDPGHKTRAYKDFNYKLEPTVYPTVEDTTGILDGEEPTN